MKVVGYEVEPYGEVLPVAEVLENISQGPKDSHLGMFGMRMEQCEVGDNRIDFDLIKALYQDIVIADDHGHTRHITKERSERYSTNTAGVYFLNTNRLFLQFNRHGVQGGLFRQYLTSHSGSTSGGYRFNRISRPGDDAAIINSKKINKLQISANLTRLEKASMLDGSVLFTLFDNMRNKAHSDRLNLTISCRKSKPDPNGGTKINTLDPGLIEELVAYSESVMAVDQKALRVNYFDIFEDDVSSALLSLLRKTWSHEEDLPETQAGTLGWPFENRRDLILRASVVAPS